MKGDYDEMLNMMNDWAPLSPSDGSGTYVDANQLMALLQLKMASTDSEGSLPDTDMDSTGCDSNPHSAPQSPRRSSRRSSVNPTRFKTELCRPFQEKGECRYGAKCQFAHGPSEMRGVSRHPKYKTEMCRTFHTTGICPYGPRCHFIHNENEYKLLQISEIKKQEITKQAVKEMAQLHARQQLVQGRVGVVIQQLQQQLILHNFMLQLKQVKAVQKVARQLAWSSPRSTSLDSSGDTPPTTPMCSSPPAVFDQPSSPLSAVRPPPGFEFRFSGPQPTLSPSEEALGASRLPIFSAFTH